MPRGLARRVAAEKEKERERDRDTARARGSEQAFKAISHTCPGAALPFASFCMHSSNPARPVKARGCHSFELAMEIRMLMLKGLHRASSELAIISR